MEMNPQRVRSAEFKTVRKGADPDEVRSFLRDVADELERAQNQSTAMEARARAAVARLQELSDSQGETATDQPVQPLAVPADQSDTISRTLVLAQRTADSLVNDAKSESARLVAVANDEAAATRDSTREMAATMLDEARSEARRTGEQERLLIAGEVDALKARRDFLESDVDHLEQFLVAQRSRLRDVAGEIIEITDRVPSGLGEVHRPLLSASDDSSSIDDHAVPPEPDWRAVVPSVDQAHTDIGSDPDEAAQSDDATQAMDVVTVLDIDDPDADDNEDFTFSFDDDPAEGPTVANP